jgi:hypothetical protein
MCRVREASPARQAPLSMLRGTVVTLLLSAGPDSTLCVARALLSFDEERSQRRVRSSGLRGKGVSVSNGIDHRTLRTVAAGVQNVPAERSQGNALRTSTRALGALDLATSREPSSCSASPCFLRGTSLVHGSAIGCGRQPDLGGSWAEAAADRRRVPLRNRSFAADLLAGVLGFRAFAADSCHQREVRGGSSLVAVAVLIAAAIGILRLMARPPAGRAMA